MANLSCLSARRRRLDAALRAAGTAGLVAALLSPLAACKGVDNRETVPLTPAGVALAASAAQISATKVPPPPVLAPVAGTTAADLSSADAQLDAALTRASSCTADTECRSIAVGARACGGPTGYRAYSSQATPASGIEALAQHERELAAQAARESHEASPCFMLADPGAHCQQNKCVTGRAAN